MRFSMLHLFLTSANALRRCSRLVLTPKYSSLPQPTASPTPSLPRGASSRNAFRMMAESPSPPSSSSQPRDNSILKRSSMKSRGVPKQLSSVDAIMDEDDDGTAPNSSSSRGNVGNTDSEYVPVVYTFKSGSVVRVKITQFGPLGASISINNGEARGLIIQREIAMFRDKRDGRDVEVGEELDGYIQKIREDGRVNVGLRPIGMNRIPSIREAIMDALEGSPDGTIPIGDKSSPEDISAYFHGLSKSDFRKAVGSLMKEGFLTPSALELKMNGPDDPRPAPSSTAASSAPSSPVRAFNKNAFKFTVFIGNLPISTTEKSLSNTIEKVMGKGVLLSLRMPVDASSKPKGFAFANFEDEESKQVAMRKLKNYEFMGRLLRAEDGDAPKRTKESAVAPPRQQQEPRPRASAGDSLEEFMSFGYSGEEESSRGERAGAGSRGEGSPRVDATLYFGNLAYAVDEAVLRDAVERVVGRGSVVSARIATDIETGRKKGFGYVDFANQDDAEKALDEMNGMSVKGRPLKVDDATRKRF